jgi:hypothetical protein
VFIKYKNEKIVNLGNVSNIFIDNHEDGSGKVIFNMNYSVKIFSNKFTPDYVYWNYQTEEELNEVKGIFMPFIDAMSWVKPKENGQRYINIQCISSISIDENKNRVIFNLNYNVTHPKDNNKLTSDFVFFHFSDKEAFNNFKNKWL